MKKKYKIQRKILNTKSTRDYEKKYKKNKEIQRNTKKNTRFIGFCVEIYLWFRNFCYIQKGNIFVCLFVFWMSDYNS